ncbi:helix-hairpin-helix domain-containing protein [Thermodesulfobacteriota bacterium]
MKTENLTKVKYIGASRMKSLKDIGITTLKQLHEAPIDKLAEIPAIGKYYAKLIKNAVKESYRQKPEKINLETVPGKEEKTEKFKEKLIKKIQILKKRLNRINEDLKPPEKKKLLEFYDEFRKRSKILINLINGLDQSDGGFSNKFSKKIIKRVDALNSEFKKVGKKIKRKKFQKLSCEIQSFSKMLKKNIS